MLGLYGLCHFSEIGCAQAHAKGGNAFVGFPPKIRTPIGAFYCTWPVVRNTNGQDLNNDAFALHSAPLALTATNMMDRQR